MIVIDLASPCYLTHSIFQSKGFHPTTLILNTYRKALLTYKSNAKYKPIYPISLPATTELDPVSCMGSFYLPYPSINKLSTHQQTVPLTSTMHWQQFQPKSSCSAEKNNLPPASFNLLSDLYHQHFQPVPGDKLQQGLNLAYPSEFLVLSSHLWCIWSLLVFNRPAFSILLCTQKT